MVPDLPLERGRVEGFAATRPAIRMMIESTLAKIGRSMKNRENLPMGHRYFDAPGAGALLAGLCGAPAGVFSPTLC